MVTDAKQLMARCLNCSGNVKVVIEGDGLKRGDIGPYYTRTLGFTSYDFVDRKDVSVCKLACNLYNLACILCKLACILCKLADFGYFWGPWLACDPMLS